MAMALLHDPLAVGGVGTAPLEERDRVGAQPHRATHVLDLLLLGQKVDHRIRRLRVELARVGALEAGHVPGELDHGHLHAQADAEVGHAVLTGEAGRGDLALDPADAEPARDQHAVRLLQLALGLLLGERLRVHPDHLEAGAVVDGGVVQRLDDG